MWQELGCHGDYISSCEYIICTNYESEGTFVTIVTISFSYNAFKLRVQDGNLNLQLSALMHMFLASCAGMDGWVGGWLDG